jgi:hypothetical protein
MGWSRREGAPGGVDFAPSELEAVNRAAEFGLTGEVAAAYLAYLPYLVASRALKH